MRVLFTNEAPLIKYGLAEGFRQAGYEAKVIQGEEERLWGRPIEEQIRRLVKAIDGFRPDFLFTEGHPGFDPDAICGLASRKGLPHLYWAIEDPVSTDYLSMKYVPHVDYVFTTTAECVPRYRAMGKGAEVLLFGCNPAFHRYTGPVPEWRHDLVLVASNYSSRYADAAWFVLPLLERGYEIRIWGYWWDDASRPVNLCRYPGVYGGLLPYEDLPSVYSSARIILGLNCHAGSLTQTSMRPYEALACGGGLYLSPYTPAQQALFGDAIYQVRDTEETIAAVETVLGLPEEVRREYARRAQEEVYGKHDYRLRAKQIVAAFNSL